MLVEIDDSLNGFRFRLIDGSRKTAWASYQQVVMLDNCVAATEYYLPTELALTPITPAQLCRSFCILEAMD